MAEMISAAESTPSPTPSRRLPPGIYDGQLIASDGTDYQLVSLSIEPAAAMRLVKEGAAVAFDECACGGTCGFIWASHDERVSLAQKPPVLRSHQGLDGMLSLWQSEAGRRTVLAQGSVTWAQSRQRRSSCRTCRALLAHERSCSLMKDQELREAARRSRKSRTLSAESRGSPAKIVGTSSTGGGWSPTRSRAEPHVERAGTVMDPRYAVTSPSRRVTQTTRGVAPIGHPAPVRTIVDVVLGNFDEVWATGGHPYLVFPTAFDELVRITGGTPADVGALPPHRVFIQRSHPRRSRRTP